MNSRPDILFKLFNYDDYERTEGIELSPSEVGSKSNYQLWLKHSGAEESFNIPTELKVNAVVGTSLHSRLELVLKDTDIHSELKLKGDIAGVTVGGTADVIYELDDTYVVGDLKSVGVFQFKKGYREHFKSYIPQLSLYSYLYSQSTGREYSRYGEVYLVVTGDAGYFRKDEGGGKTPKYITETIELLDKHEVEELVINTMSAIQNEPEMDCQDAGWNRCLYCTLDCDFRIEEE